jgi:hypothetical protein
MKKVSSYLVVAIIILSSCKKNSDTINLITPPTTLTEWSKSYDPGYLDNNGKFAGGNEIMQIVAHKGKLYAGNSYWMEPDINKRSAEILRLDYSNSKWQVDKELTNENLRVGVMKSFIFTTNSAGINITPDTLLITIPNNNLGNLQQYLRDDIANNWNIITVATLGNDINIKTQLIIRHIFLRV